MISPAEIIQYRKRHGLNQEDLARMIGVSIRTVQNYEHGGKIPQSKMGLFKSLLDAELKENELKDFQSNDLNDVFEGIPIQDICLYVINNFDQCMKNPSFKMLIDNISTKKALKILKDL
jgi:transcriptional regulator with XRE-family HTH domain